jgi:hypothetical protein
MTDTEHREAIVNAANALNSAVYLAAKDGITAELRESTYQEIGLAMKIPRIWYTLKRVKEIT